MTPHFIVPTPVAPCAGVDHTVPEPKSAAVGNSRVSPQVSRWRSDLRKLRRVSCGRAEGKHEKNALRDPEPEVTKIAKKNQLAFTDGGRKYLSFFFFLAAKFCVYFRPCGCHVSPALGKDDYSEHVLEDMSDGRYVLSSSVQFHKRLLLIVGVSAKMVMVRFPAFCAVLAK